jgi:O-antigen ligase
MTHVGLLPGALLLAAILMRIFVIRPSRTIVPLYAASLPIASAIDVPIPLPAPFNSLSSVLGAVAIVTCAGHLLIYRRTSIPSGNAGLWVLFLGWACLTGFWALEPASAFRTMMIASSLIALMLIVSALPLTARDFEAIRFAVMLSGLIVGLYAVYLQAIGAQFPTHGVSQRFSITTDPEQSDPNILAASLLMPLGLALEQMVLGTSRWWRNWSDSRSRALGTIAALFTTISILFTASRGGLVSAIIVFAGTLFYCAKAPGGRERVRATLRSIGVTLLGGTIAIMLTAYFLPRLTARAETRLLNPAIQRTLRAQGDPSGRGEIWQAGLVACENHCLLGVGIGNFARIYNQVFAFSGADENVGYNRVAHNLYLSLAVETGLVGLTLFGVALVAEWARLSSPRMMSIGPSFKPLLIGLLIANIFLSAVWFKYFWLVFTLIRAAEASASPSMELERDHPLPPQVRWSAYAADA